MAGVGVTKSLIPLCLMIAAGCGGPTPIEKYETALHIFVMERQRVDSYESTPLEQRNETYYKRSGEQSERLQRAKKRLDEAEAAL